MKSKTLKTTAIAVIAAAVATASHVGGAMPTDDVLSNFSAANGAAREGKFAEARQTYESLIAEGYRSAPIHYNLGLVAAKLGDLGGAVLHLERAAALNPNILDLDEKLLEIRREAGSEESHQHAGWSAYTAFASANTWSLLASISVITLTLLAATATLKIRQLPPKVMLAAAVLCVSLCTFSISAAVSQHNRNNDRAIVLNPDTPLRVSPFDDANAMTTLPAGRSVRFLDESAHEDFSLVQLDNGQSGWLKEGETAFITPR